MIMAVKGIKAVRAFEIIVFFDTDSTVSFLISKIKISMFLISKIENLNTAHTYFCLLLIATLLNLM